MKCFVYILQSENGTYYVGSTTDVAKRLKQHNSGHTYSTHRMGKLNLVFSQEFESVLQARGMETKIKAWKRRDYIDKIVQDQVIKIARP